MAYNVPADEGLHFAFGPWPNCVMAVTETAIGEAVIVGVGAVGSVEYDSIAMLWGPGALSDGVAAAGSLGAFLVGLMPAANAALKAALNIHPGWAPITAGSPITVDNANIALAEYFQVLSSADGSYEVISFKPYP